MIQVVDWFRNHPQHPASVCSSNFLRIFIHYTGKPDIEAILFTLYRRLPEAERNPSMQDVAETLLKKIPVCCLHYIAWTISLVYG